MSDGGKGSSPRPFSVSYQNFSDNWDLIFKKTEKSPEPLQQAITKEGELVEFREGYWNQIENKK